MNSILILSCGTRNKVLQAFKKTLPHVHLIASDCNPAAPALYEADERCLLPRMSESDYEDKLKALLLEKKPSLVLSLIDPELSVLARMRPELEAQGTKVMISNPELVEMSFDKYAFSKALREAGLPSVPTYKPAEALQALDAGELTFPLFVKPQCGSASIRINRVTTRQELEALLAEGTDLVVQPLMLGPELGKEYGVDCYFDMTDGHLVDLFIKEKLLMRAGETDKSISRHHQAIADLLTRFASHFPFRGVIDIDIFETGGSLFISEVNPRFGGGYPHAYGAGVNFPALLAKNFEGTLPHFSALSYPENLVMMKYNEVLIKPQNELVH